MRVLALVTDGFGSSGGIAYYNQSFATALARAGGRIVVVPRFGAPDDDLPSGVEQIDAAAGAARWSLNAMRAAARGFDIIFCGHLYTVPLAAMLARLAGKPLWLQVHGIEAWQPPRRSVQRAAAQARLITAVSRYTRRRLLAWADVDPAQVRVLSNTMAANRSLQLRAGSARSPALQDRHGLSGKRVILTVSRLSTTDGYKGHDRVIAVLPQILERHDAVYLIVGAGDDMPRLQAVAAASGVADRVRFAGHVAAAEIADYFRLADVFAMPSDGEGFGIVFIEAAACGLPVIAGNRDGSVDALADGRIGRLIDPHDLEQLRDAILDAFAAPRASDPAAVGRFAFANFARLAYDLAEDLLPAGTALSRNDVRALGQ